MKSFIIFQPDNYDKVIKGTKTATSRTHPVRNGLHEISANVFIDVKCFHYNKFKDMKNPEAWAKAEGFKSIADMKVNSKYKHTKDFIAGKRDLYVYTFSLVK